MCLAWIHSSAECFVEINEMDKSESFVVILKNISLFAAWVIHCTKYLKAQDILNCNQLRHADTCSYAVAGRLPVARVLKQFMFLCWASLYKHIIPPNVGEKAQPSLLSNACGKHRSWKAFQQAPAEEGALRSFSVIRQCQCCQGNCEQRRIIFSPSVLHAEYFSVLLPAQGLGKGSVVQQILLGQGPATRTI